MVDKLMRNSLSIPLSTDLFLVFVISNVENDDSHIYEVEKGSYILHLIYAFLLTSECLF